MNAGADRPLRVAVIGCGGMALGGHLPIALSMPDKYSVVAVADRSPERLRSAAELAQLDERGQHIDAATVIADPEIDAVVIATPPHARAGIAVSALRSGKHVLCEKPLAITAAAATEAVSAAAEAGRCLAMVHNYLFLPEIVAVNNSIAAGDVGEVRLVTINALGVCDNPGASEYNWRHDAAVAGGGVLMDMLHLVYLAEKLVGRPFEKVSAYVDAEEAGAGVESLALCRFETLRSAALVNLGWGMGPGGLVVTGTKGRVEVRYENGGTSPFSPLKTVELVDDVGQRSIEVGGTTSPLRSIWTDFYKSVKNNGQPIADGADGLRALEAVLGAYASAALERTVQLPLDATDPVFLEGVAGIRSYKVNERSVLVRKGLYT